ncbi:hypothetical protein CMV_026013 [Castanea mollissima]|uniref:Uncharacterized protein n=1 Tax=Castanea mollissima TaxID=60419 RepID=A0A8J4Q8H9_9ROSI|nr:hypothetical protein CMV_026013 [Castanea mollissima]
MELGKNFSTLYARSSPIARSPKEESHTGSSFFSFPPNSNQPNRLQNSKSNGFPLQSTVSLSLHLIDLDRDPSAAYPQELVGLVSDFLVMDQELEGCMFKFNLKIEEFS